MGVTSKQIQKYSIEELLNSEAIVHNSISHNDQFILYSSDKSGVYNAYSIGMDSGESRQLTNSTDNAIFAISYFPNDQRFLYLSDEGGNEILHIYVCDKDGNVTDLTPTKGERAEFYGWSKDEKSFFYGSNKRNPKYMDVYEMEISTYNSKRLFDNNDGYSFGTISSDKKLIALNKVVNANNSNMYVYNCDTKEVTCLSNHHEEAQYLPQTFESDTNELYYLTNEDSEFLQLKRIRIDEPNKNECIASEGWDITNAYFSNNDKFLVYSLNKDALTVVKVIDTVTQKEVLIPNMPDGQISSIQVSRSEKMISFLLNSSTSPNNLYVFNLESKKLKKLTHTLSPMIDERNLAKAEVVRYRSFDDLEIPAIYYQPHVKEGEKVPALVWVHGGPGGQSRVDYNPLFQYLVNHGYAVIAVNNRGSSGYGKTFFKAADLKHGEVDLADCIEAKTFLKSLNYIDDSKIGIMGGSYGGYMVLAALAFKSEEFKVGVDIFGVSNWERTLKSIPSWWESFRDALYKKLGNPYTQIDYIRSISPLFHADNIKKPLIVLQGANDPRVLQVESDEIVDSLKKNKVPVEYIVFPDEGHGFTKKQNRITGFKAILSFLDRYLN